MQRELDGCGGSNKCLCRQKQKGLKSGLVLVGVQQFLAAQVLSRNMWHLSEGRVGVVVGWGCLRCHGNTWIQTGFHPSWSSLCRLGFFMYQA
jgi:hypothetical protein